MKLFSIETQPLQDRIRLFRRIRIHNEDPAHFQICRRQFPMRLVYAMSIHKAQGQTLRRAGLYLKNNVFTHGQLYVAFSRVSDPKNLSIFIDSDKNQHGWRNGCAYTSNIVNKHLLQEEIEKYKNGPDYGNGPMEFTDGNSMHQFSLNVFII